MHKLVLILFLSSFLTKANTINLPDSKRATTVRTSVWPKLQQDLAAQKFNKDLRVYIRIIKQNDLLEIWAKKGSKYEFFKRYNICYYSGGPGTKIRSGDNKSP
jgi:murein L,D-transpeptidase YafK